MEMQMSEHSNAPIRVLIVDDHAILRQGICLMLNEEDEFEEDEFDEEEEEEDEEEDDEDF